MISTRTAGCLLAVFFLLHGVIPLTAKTLTFDEEKCHVDVPDDWKEQGSTENKVSAINADQTKSFTLRTVNVGAELRLDDASFIKGFENSVTGNGFTITARLHVSLAGIDAYALDASRTMPAGPVDTRMMVTVANNYAYCVNISKVNGMAADDPELAAIVSSFGFTGTPELPASQSDQLSFRLGELVGGVLLPVLVVIVLFKWIRRKRS